MEQERTFYVRSVGRDERRVRASQCTSSNLSALFDVCDQISSANANIFKNQS